MKVFLRKLRVLRNVARHRILPNWFGSRLGFSGSSKYWEERYSSGGNSGVGSQRAFADFKAEVINGFVAVNEVGSVLEFGCGDGVQLMLARYPMYLGFDVSATAVHRCRRLFADDATKTFELMGKYDGQTADLVLSLDVVYHLIEDETFDAHMLVLFSAARRYVIIYSSDMDDPKGAYGAHVRHRKFSRWIEEHRADWRLVERIPNKFPYEGDHKTGSFADFFIYERDLT